MCVEMLGEDLLVHLLGIDHERFTVKHQGLDQRLTGVEKANVVSGILDA